MSLYGDFSQQQPTKNLSDKSEMIQINSPKYLKGKDYSEFIKNFTTPTVLDRTSIINLSKYRDLKLKKDVLVYTYDIFQNDTLDLIEDHMKILTNINHPNIIKFSEVYVKKPKNNINTFTYFHTTAKIVDKNPSTLQDIILNPSERQKLKSIDYKRWFFHIASALNTLHGQGIFHNNLLPSSIILDKYTAILTKFGFGFEYLIDTLHQNQPYFAPEVFDSPKFSSETDVYSMGVLFLKLLTSKDLDVSEMEQDEILDEISSDLKKGFGENLLKMICNCIKEKPSERTKILDIYLELKKEESDILNSMKEPSTEKKDTRKKTEEKEESKAKRSMAKESFSPKSTNKIESRRVSELIYSDKKSLPPTSSKSVEISPQQNVKFSSPQKPKIESSSISEKRALFDSEGDIQEVSLKRSILQRDIQESQDELGDFQEEEMMDKKEEIKEKNIVIEISEPNLPKLKKKDKKKDFELDEEVLEFAKEYADSPEKISIIYAFTRDVLLAQKLKKQNQDTSELEKDLSNRLAKLPSSLILYIDKNDIIKGNDFIKSIKDNKRIELEETMKYYNMRSDSLEYLESKNDMLKSMEKSYKGSAKKKGGMSFSFPSISCDCFRPKERVPTEKELEKERLKQELQYGQARKENYQISKVLGEGCSGSVYLVKKNDPKNDTVYVMKVFKTGSEGDANQEIAALQSLKDTNGIVEFIESFSFDDGYGTVQKAIVMEYCEQGDLTSLTKKKKGKFNVVLNEVKIIEIMIQIFNSLNSIHSKKFIHRDIKPANVFIKKGGKIKIGDFGFTIHIHNTKNPILGGSLEYMAPEQWEEKTEIGTFAIDIWSSGCILLELLTKKVRDVKVELASSPDFLTEIWKKEKLPYSEKLKEILSLCFVNEPRDRPEASTLQKHLNILLIQHFCCLTIQSCVRGYLQRKVNLENVSLNQ